MAAPTTSKPFSFLDFKFIDSPRGIILSSAQSSFAMDKLKLTSITLILLFIFSSLVCAPIGLVDNDVSASEAVPFEFDISEKVTYGIFVLPDYKTNVTRAKASGDSGTHLEGIGWLYTRLMQHSSCRFINWQEIESNTADVDVTIFWEPKYMTDADLSVIASYMESNSCLIIGKHPFRANEVGIVRTPATNSDFHTIQNLLGIYSMVDTIDNRMETGTAHYATVLTQIGSFSNNSVVDYPYVEFNNNPALKVNYSLSGAMPLLNYSGSSIQAKSVAAGRIMGDDRYAIVTGLYAHPLEIELFYNLCLWVGNDTQVSLNMWPNGKSFAAFQRWDDRLNIQMVKLMENLSVPTVYCVNNGGITSDAMAYLNSTDADYLIGLHGTNHSYDFWGSSVGGDTAVDAASYAANILDNQDYVRNFSSRTVDGKYFSTPGDRRPLYLWEGIDIAGVDGIGCNPMLLYSVQKRPYDLTMMPYHYPLSHSAGTTTAWFMTAAAAYNPVGTLGPDVNLTTMYSYAKAGVYQNYGHYTDYADYAAFESAVTAYWNDVKSNDDVWMALPDQILSYMEQRETIQYTISNGNITVSNTGAKNVLGVGFNFPISSSVGITVDGAPTNNIHYSNGNAYVWLDVLAPGDHSVISITDGMPSGRYSIIIDDQGNLSPYIGSQDWTIVNNNQNNLNVDMVIPKGRYVVINESGSLTKINSNGLINIAIDGDSSVLIMTESEYRQEQLNIAISPLFAIIPVLIVLAIISMILRMVKRF